MQFAQNSKLAKHHLSTEAQWLVEVQDLSQVISDDQYLT